MLKKGENAVVDCQEKERIPLKDYIGMDVSFGSLNKNTHRRNEITFNINSSQIYDKEKKNISFLFMKMKLLG